VSCLDSDDRAGHRSDVDSRRKKALGDLVPQVMKTDADHVRSLAECSKGAGRRIGTSVSLKMSDLWRRRLQVML
jgi:hypothetical protein